MDYFILFLPEYQQINDYYQGKNVACLKREACCNL